MVERLTYSSKSHANRLARGWKMILPLDTFLVQPDGWGRWYIIWMVNQGPMVFVNQSPKEFTNRLTAIRDGKTEKTDA